MAFNMRLAFLKTNGHGAQLYKDPMNMWVVKIEYHRTTFEASPWVHYTTTYWPFTGGKTGGVVCIFHFKKILRGPGKRPGKTPGLITPEIPPV